jgi:inosine/xanthosine triphosphate pyrophosphatase family protein
VFKLKQILFATGNPTKAKRFSESLLKKEIEVISLKDIDLDIEIDENGKTAIENALIKARAYYKETGITTMAMDDTLYLDNVPKDKQPGLYVRRINGKRLTDDEMLNYYSNLVKEYGINGKITARWIYGMAIIKNGIEYTYTWSKEDFYLTDIPSNIINPGYPLNSISINKKLNKYFTDLTEEDKNLIAEDESNVIDFITSNI